MYQEKALSRSLSPPENGFRQMEQRLYSSQGRGPTRVGRHGHEPRSHSHEPRSHAHTHTHELRSHSNTRLPIPHSAPGGGTGHYSRRAEHANANANGYDTDSSQDSRDRHGYSHGSRLPPTSRANRAWRPMREALNVDSVLTGQERPPQGSPRRRPSNHERPQERDNGNPADSWLREERKPKSLMTIYEDEQRSAELGSRSSLDSDGRGGGSGGASVPEERPMGQNSLQVRHEAWRIQRTESGYESSDRLSNGSASLDSPGVESFAGKDLRPIPELHTPR